MPFGNGHGGECDMNNSDLKEMEFLTARQLAKTFNLSLKSIVRWTQEGRVPGQTKFGRVWRYDRNEIEKRLLSGNFLLR